MDLTPKLQTKRFTLSPLQASDIPALTHAAADPLIWEQHPAKDRWKADVFEPYVTWLLAQGGTLTIRSAAGMAKGMSRFYQTPDIAPDWGIGFTFLTRDLWGGTANAEVKGAMIDHLAAQGANAVWLHFAPDNTRSLRATGKLGATRAEDEVVDYGFGPSRNARMVIFPKTNFAS